MQDAPHHRTPIEYHDGYLPLEDYGLIGDGHTAALVGRDGAVHWMCLPRFDSPPVFCRLLDPHGGLFSIAPDEILTACQYYEPDTAVLVSELQGREGLLRITDACLLKTRADLTRDASADRGVLLRTLQVLSGRVRVVLSVSTLHGTSYAPRDGGLQIAVRDRSDLVLQLQTSLPLSGLRTTWQLEAGAHAHVSLAWKGTCSEDRSSAPQEQLDATRSAWREWMRHVAYDGPHRDQVRRSAITLKLLDHFANGAIVAAPTSSLPERIGGSRNWDYRFSWIRDAAFSVHAMRRIGLGYEASGFLRWVLHAAKMHRRPRVLYTVDGSEAPDETEDPSLAGYRGSQPVRWGNAAAHQRQHDVFGEVLDCAYQWVRHGGVPGGQAGARVDERLWNKLCELADSAGQEWHQPDRGIWEVRTEGHPYTYSAALCQVALDRAVRIAEHFRLSGPVDRWRAEARHIRDAILEQAWNPRRKTLTEYLGGGGLDASLLALPLRYVVDACHPRMLATSEAIVTHLSAGDGLLYRYDPSESPDGLAGHEGAFLLCSFWLVENLVLRGKVDEAGTLFDSLCSRTNHLGLLPEQVDPTSGAFLGNYPQAMSHVGLVSSAVRLAAAGRAPATGSARQDGAR